MSVKYTKGIGMVEVIIGISVILVVVLSLITVYNTFLKISFSNSLNIQATSLLEEGVEAVKIMRDSSWNNNIKNLTNDTTAWLLFDGSTWKSSQTKVLIDNTFERSFTLSSVFRDANGNISATPGSLDQNTKFVTINVFWFDNNSKTTLNKSLSFYLTNLFNN